MDPDGRETDDTAEGKIIHSLISAYYQMSHNSDVVYANKSMSSILYKLGFIDKGLGRTDLGIRPDIWNVSTNELYEIKPASQGAKVAEEQLNGYISLASKFGLNVRAGSSDSPGTSGTFVLPGTKTSVTYWSPSQGVILYSKKQSVQPQTNFNYDVEINPYMTTLLIILGITLMGSGIPVPIIP